MRNIVKAINAKFQPDFIHHSKLVIKTHYTKKLVDLELIKIVAEADARKNQQETYAITKEGLAILKKNKAIIAQKESTSSQMTPMDFALFNEALSKYSPYHEFDIFLALDKTIIEKVFNPNEVSVGLIANYMLHFGFSELNENNNSLHRLTERGRKLRSVGDLILFNNTEEEEKQRERDRERLGDIILENNVAITTAAKWQRWIFPILSLILSIIALVISLVKK